MSGRAPLSLLVVCGLAREARIVAGEGTRVLCGDAPTLRAGLDAVSGHPDLVVSFGLCGGLDPTLRSGDVVVGTTVVAAEARALRDWVDSPNRKRSAPDSKGYGHFAIGWSHPMAKYSRLAFDAGLGQELAQRLTAAGMRARTGTVAAVEAPVLTRQDKAALANATGAVAVDMESLIAARFAAERGLPFAALRAISDPADRALPPLVLKATKADGSLDLKAVMAAVLGSPAQIPGLVAAGRDSAAAFAALGRVRRCLPGLFLGLGLADL